MDWVIQELKPMIDKNIELIHFVNAVQLVVVRWED